MDIPSRQRYRKRVGAFMNVDLKHDKSVIGFSTAARCYNFDVNSGALRAGYGIESHHIVPEGALRFWAFRYYSESAGEYIDQYIFQDKRGMLSFYDSSTGKTRYMSGFAYEPMSAVNYRLKSKDVLLMSCEGMHLYVWDGKMLTEYSDTPIISSMALHYERLFVTSSHEPTKVFFSDDLDPTNWSIGLNEGGFIELLDERGYLNKVVSFGSYLYIFREHGISRVTAFADQSEFSVLNLFVTAGRIYPESIVKCGSCIMFLATDGLYMFDGYECRKVLTELDGLFSGTVGAAEFYNGKYYLSFAADFGDGEIIGCENGSFTCNALLVFDITSGEYSLARGMDISFIGACTYRGEDFLAACDGIRGGVITRCGCRFGEELYKLWISPPYDFGMPDKTKAVREAYIKCSGECKISVIGDRKNAGRIVTDADSRIRFNIAGRRISLAVYSYDSKCNIEPPTLVYSVY